MHAVFAVFGIITEHFIRPFLREFTVHLAHIGVIRGNQTADYRNQRDCPDNAFCHLSVLLSIIVRQQIAVHKLPLIAADIETDVIPVCGSPDRPPGVLPADPAYAMLV